MDCTLIELDPRAISDPEPLRVCLSEAEQQRLSHFRAESPRREFLLSRVLLRHTLGLHLGLPPAQVPLLRSPQGKPYLPDTPLHINLTHTQGCIALALCAAAPIGVDVEWLARPVRPHLASRFFSPQEIAELEAHPQAEARAQHFLHLWTLKEAWWKAHDPPYDFDMTALTLRWHPLRLCDAAGQPQGSLESWTTAEHRYALAVTTPQVTLRVERQPFRLMGL